MKQGVLIFALFLIGFLASDINSSSLKLVQVVFRHGIRRPILNYPNAIHNDSFWNSYNERIRNVSKSQLQDLAIYLKKMYPKIVDDSSKVVVKSTNTSRTKQSAMDTMNELFGSSNTHDLIILDKDTYPGNFDSINCTELMKLKIESRSSSEYHQYIGKNKETINKLMNYSDVNNSPAFKSQNLEFNAELYMMWVIGDMAIIERDLSLPLPDWVTENMNDLLDIYKYSMKLDFCYKNVAKIIAGPLLYELIENINSTLNTQNNAQLHLYSSHDSYIMSLLNLLNPKYEMELPSWASALIFELHEKSNDYYIKIYYKNTETTNNTVLIDGCQEECPLSQFFELISTKQIKNRDSVCSTNTEKKGSELDAHQAIIPNECKVTLTVAICGLVLSIAAVVALIIIFVRSRRNAIKLSTSNTNQC